MVVSRMVVRNLFIEEARALRLLAFFIIAERVAGNIRNMAVNPRMSVSTHSRTDSEACANANYGQLKIHKRSQNLSLQQLFVEESTGSRRWVTLQPFVVSMAWICSGVSHLWTWLRGPSPKALTLIEGVMFIVWCLRFPFLGKYWWDPRHFWSCQTCLG